MSIDQQACAHAPLDRFSCICPMLVAQLGGRRIEARRAYKGEDFLCPGCRTPVILKKGRIVTPHFAHKPPVTCKYGVGETELHRQAKQAFRDEFVNRGLPAEVEYEVSCLPNDRRADVLVWSPTGRPYAIELQHSSIGYDNLEQRTRSYLAAAVRVLWIPFIDKRILENAEKMNASTEGDLRVEPFAVRPIERRLDAIYFHDFWFFEPHSKKLYRSRAADCLLWREPTDYFDEDGNEVYNDGYYYVSSRYKTITLWGPFHLSQVKLCGMEREPESTPLFSFPGGSIAQLTT